MLARRLNACLRDFSEALGPLGGRVVIAGGAVRDALRFDIDPKDFDVFVLGQSVTSAALAQALSIVAPRYETLAQLEFHKSEPYLVASVRWDGSIVQVMLSEHGTVEALLDSFDWNVSRFAYDGERVYPSADVSAIGEGLPLCLHKVTFPLSTLRRGFRFSERFGMEFRHDDIVSLCRQVVAAEDREVLR